MASVAPPRLQPESAPSISAPNRSLLEHGWWSVVAWTCGLALGAGALSDNSFLTHLATGRLILESGVPTNNPFLYSARIYPGSAEFPIPSWLWSVVLGGVDAVAGGAGLRAAINALLTDLDRAITGFARLAVQHRDTAVVARTWLQHALPMPFGLKLAEYAAALHRSRERLKRLRTIDSRTG